MSYLVAATDDFLVAATDTFLVTAPVDGGSPGVTGVNVATVPATSIRLGAANVIKVRSGATIIWES